MLARFSHIRRLEQHGSVDYAHITPKLRDESKKFMLPPRLGTVNASEPQDLIVLALTHKGRVETLLPAR